jgi:hypothetical protein
MEELLEVAFSVVFVPRLYNADQMPLPEVENKRDLNLAVVMLTTVQVTKLPL